MREDGGKMPNDRWPAGDVFEATRQRLISPEQAAARLLSRRDRLLRASAAAQMTRGLILLLLAAGLLFAVYEALK